MRFVIFIMEWINSILIIISILPLQKGYARKVKERFNRRPLVFFGTMQQFFLKKDTSLEGPI